MKKLYLLLPILFLIYWGCEEESLCSSDEVELWGDCYSIENTTELHLYNNELTGSIPSEIGNLTNLERLYLYDNQLTGSIPPEIGNLINLTYLNLSYNQLSGGIPEEICDLSIDWDGNTYYGPDYFQINNNQLCPPYPSCIEDNVGVQDTTNCN